MATPCKYHTSTRYPSYEVVFIVNLICRQSLGHTRNRDLPLAAASRVKMPVPWAGCLRGSLRCCCRACGRKALFTAPVPSACRSRALPRDVTLFAKRRLPLDDPRLPLRSAVAAYVAKMAVCTSASPSICELALHNNDHQSAPILRLMDTTVNCKGLGDV
jgi:hypothetical protein